MRSASSRFASSPVRSPRRAVLAAALTAALVAAVVTATGTPAARAETVAAPAAPTVRLNGPVVDAGAVRAPAPLDDLLEDQGTGVLLPDGRTLWIFADTADVYTPPYVFVTSSAAFSDPATPTRLRYVVDGAGKPAEFLARTPAEQVKGADGSYTGVWPMGATVLPDGRIIVAYSKFLVKPSIGDFVFQASGLFEYRYPGYDKLAAPVTATRIANDQWKPADGEIASPVYANGFVYFTSCEGFSCYSLRTTPDGLTDRATYRWWTGGGWSPARGDRRPMAFGGNLPSTHPSVQWVPALGSFVMSDTSMGAPTATGLVWVAAAPQGPWSAPVEIPLPGCDRGCYLPNVHPMANATAVQIAYAATGELGPSMRAVNVPLVTGVRPRIETYAAPVALLDTRSGLGAAGPLATGVRQPVSVVRSGQLSTLSHVTVAVRVSGATRAGRVSLRPSGSEAVLGTVDYGVGDTDPRVLRLPPGANGRISVTNEGAPADVRVELLGWWSPGWGRTYATLTPTVVADSATGAGLPAGPLAAGTAVRAVVAPAGTAGSTAAMMLRITARTSSGTGALRVRRAGSSAAVQPSLTLTAGATTTNTVWVPVDDTGAVELRVDGAVAQVRVEALATAR